MGVQVEKCCFCATLETGSVVIAVLGVIGGCFSIGATFATDPFSWSMLAGGVLVLVASGLLFYGI